ncbi:MAG: Gfo/Idh/MocA family oxidoreductase [Pirellulales bacterium]|nr:Gfo/Idh/MocA family oxidoreductase [Pirellulales bacterium]
MPDVVRIGILGAARIVPEALLKPAKQLAGTVEVAAVAARDRARAEAFAAKHGIGRVAGSYAELLADPQLDAIYIPLPNSLHAEWSIRALESGKHVLCEKPIASNAAEAEQMAAAAARTGKLLVEAMHWRYHPLAARIREIIDSGVLGPIKRIDTWACVPILGRRDIRYQYELGGGALMDLGCYAISVLRFAAAAEPQVTAADVRLATPNVDRWLQADLQFADGRAGRITCSMWSTDFLRGELVVKGAAGTLRVGNPYAPHLMHNIVIKTAAGKQSEKLRGLPTTYFYQLQAFAAAVRGGPAPLTGPDEALATMRVIDACYQAAGLPVRGATAACASLRS